MKVLVSEKLDAIGLDILKEEMGFEVDVRVGISYDALLEIISDYDGMIIRSGTLLDEKMLSRATHLKVIGRAGIGLDNVDVPFASKKGVVVMNTPTENIITTAEHAIAMMLSLSRKIPKGTATLKNGKWEKKKLMGYQLAGKTLGIIGFGKIGSIVANRGEALQMNVVVHDPYINGDTIKRFNYTPLSLSELYQTADYISLHLPKAPATLGIINKEAFDQMKDGVMLVNCARGGIINESDLNDAIISGKVSGAALDVFENEPPGKSPLFEHDQVICTPHLGASTKEAQMNVARAISQQIVEFLKNGTIINAVNMPSTTKAYLDKISPYIQLGDQIGSVTAQLLKDSIQSVELTYFGHFEEEDRRFITTSVLKGLLKYAVKETVSIVNAPFIAKDFGIDVRENHTEAKKEYVHLIEVKTSTSQKTMTVHGTIIGKNDSRIIKIDKFRLEMNPSGNMALIHNVDCPGSIGQIATTLGENGINIEQMQVGQEEKGERNIIFIATDKLISKEIALRIAGLSTVNHIDVLTF